MKQLLSLALLLCFAIGYSQKDAQTRYNSNYRQFYVWNEEKQTYELKDTEYEHSVIDVREINASNNGYVVISMTDDAKTRMYHGSITGFRVDGTENIWSLRSKILKAKLVYDPLKDTFTYSYEANGDRYMKIFVFKLTDEI